MKLSIRMKIFLPVMVLLAIFPLAAWLVFSKTLDAHMDFNARRDLEMLVRRTEEILLEERKAVNGAGQDDQADDDLMERLRNISKGKNGESQMLIMNGKFRVIYPKNYADQPEMSQIYSGFLSKNPGGTGTWEEGVIFEETLGEKRYMMYYEQIAREDSRKARYVVIYCPIHETERILDQVSRLVLMIMAAMAAVAILVFWFVAGSISGPVRRLCEAARGIGEKRFQKVETKATVKELCELEEEINRMQEKLAQADQAERAFFQNASHELRTPLMSISGYAQGIQCGVFSDASQAAAVILEESSRLTEVVDGILTLTRMDQLRYHVVPVEIELNDFIESHMTKLEGLAFSRQIKLEFEPGEAAAVTIDATLLERAFMNVMSNCIRYARTKVEIRLESRGSQFRLSIEDDGPGIRSEELAHLFERFYKGRNGNHGLGLAIAKSSLEYMGGEIEAYSSSQGALFEMILPQDCRSLAVEPQTVV